MYNPATRLLTILELLQSRGQMSGQELAEALEVEQRSLRRYILMLRDMGIPVEGERGRYGGYMLRPGFRIPPLMFSAEEITAVTLGLMLMRETGILSHQAIESALAKIERVIPVELQQQTRALQQALIADTYRDIYRVSSELILTFSLAIYQRSYLDIDYLAGNGTVTQRRIAPYGLMFNAHTCYVPAFCLLRNDMRLFRLDRVQTVTPTTGHFERPANFDTFQFVVKSLSQQDNVYTFEVLLNAPYLTAKEIIPSTLGFLEDHGNTTLLRVYSDDPHWMARYLAKLEISFKVQQTDELRDALRVLAMDLLDSV